MFWVWKCKIRACFRNSLQEPRLVYSHQSWFEHVICPHRELCAKTFFFLHQITNFDSYWCILDCFSIYFGLFVKSEYIKKKNLNFIWLQYKKFLLISATIKSKVIIKTKICFYIFYHHKIGCTSVHDLQKPFPINMFIWEHKKCLTVTYRPEV